jgi:hypothetical protein
VTPVAHGRYGVGPPHRLFLAEAVSNWLPPSRCCGRQPFYHDATALSFDTQARASTPVCLPEALMTSAERLARAVLLFHHGSEWSADNRVEWEVVTGSTEATAEVLCDVAREVLADVQGRRQPGRAAR